MEEAVFTIESGQFNNLIGWSKKSINNAKLRLLDKKFTWSIGIEESIPLTKKHANKKINRSEVRKIIKEILEERK